MDPNLRNLESLCGSPFGSNDKEAVNPLRAKLDANLGLKQAVITHLAKQGLPIASLKSAATNSLALSYCIPSYLKSWRNRINPAFDLLGNADGDDNDFDANFGKTSAQATQTAAVEQGEAGGAFRTKAESEAFLKDLFAQVNIAVERLVSAKLASTRLQLDPGAKEEIKSLGREAALAAVKENEKPRVIEIHDTKTGELRSLGLQHESFPKLLRACQAKDHRGFRLNIWLTGPTGSGKTTAGENVAKALALPFGSDGSLDADYKVMGFRDANGHIISTQFLEIFEKGGIYLADEIDNWLPSALLALNAALANGFVSAPKGIIRRHPDCIVIACANTWGHGATNDYVGRTKQDAATLDRFQPKIHWPLDERLEAAIALNVASTLGRAWHVGILAARAAVATQGLKVIISPRATFSGISLLQAGFTFDEVIDMTVAAGLSEDQKAMVLRAIKVSGAHALYDQATASVETDVELLG